MFSTVGYYICIPFAALLRLFYNLTGSYGVAIVLFTLVIKLIMLPFQIKSKKSMIRMNRMSGRMQDLQKRYANNQAKLQEEMQKLYEEEGVNPMSGCLWSFLPLPILLALYSIIRQPITHFMMISEEVMMGLFSKVQATGIDVSSIVTMKDGAVNGFTPYGQINLVNVLNSQLPQAVEGVDKWINVNYQFLGLDLAVNPGDLIKNFSFSWAVVGLLLIPILTGVTQLVMSWYTMKHQPTSSNNASMKTMMYMMPLMTVYFAFVMPAALGVYWIAQTVFSMVQEVLMTKFFNQKFEDEENARYEAVKADRQRRMEEGRKAQEERRNQQEQKQSLRDKQRAAQEAKAKKAAKAKTSTTEAGRVGERPYARGRSYKADRYDD